MNSPATSMARLRTHAIAHCNQPSLPSLLKRRSTVSFTNSCGSGLAIVKLNLLETIAFDRHVGPQSIVGARRPPAFQDGSPSKFCSPLEVVGTSGAEHLDRQMSRISPKCAASFRSCRRGAHDCPGPATWAEAAQ